MKFVRWFLGRIILLIDFIFSPKRQQRDEQSQAMVDQQAQALALYQFNACPFCVKVRRAMKRQNLNIELRDAKNDAVFREELQKEGGKIKVPCLRIADGGGVTWMYESNDIIDYLSKRFD